MDGTPCARSVLSVCGQTLGLTTLTHWGIDSHALFSTFSQEVLMAGFSGFTSAVRKGGGNSSPATRLETLSLNYRFLGQVDEQCSLKLLRVRMSC